MKPWSLSTLCLVACLLTSVNARAGTDSFLYLDGINGEVTFDGFENWINVSSWSWQMSSDGTGSPVVRGLRINKVADVASAAIQARLLTGTPVATAQLSVRLVGGAEPVFMEIVMTNVRFTNVAISVDAAADVGTSEVISLSFSSVCYRYRQIAPDYSAGPWTENCHTLPR